MMNDEINHIALQMGVWWLAVAVKIWCKLCEPVYQKLIYEILKLNSVILDTRNYVLYHYDANFKWAQLSVIWQLLEVTTTSSLVS